MASRATLRASDADREAVAQHLHAAALEGRLETDELDERLGVALSARTYGELDALLADLPAGNALTWRRPRAQVGPAAQQALAIALPLLMTLALVAVVVTVAAIAAAWWLVWVLMGFVMCGRKGCAPRSLARAPGRAHRRRQIA